MQLLDRQIPYKYTKYFTVLMRSCMLIVVAVKVKERMASLLVCLCNYSMAIIQHSFFSLQWSFCLFQARFAREYSITIV